MKNKDLIINWKDSFMHVFKSHQIWLKQRIESIMEIRNLASELHGHQKNVNIARVAGTSVGAAATVAGAVFTGLALAPFTAGASVFIGLGIGAGVVGGAGVGTSLGASLTMRSIEKKRWEVLKEILKKDRKNTDTLQEDIKNYNKILLNLILITKEEDNIVQPTAVIEVLRDAFTVAEKLTLTASAAGVAAAAVKDGVKIALMASRVLGGIGITLSGNAQILDVIILVEDSKNISRGSKCNDAKKMEEILKTMEKEKEDLDDYIEEILECVIH